MNVNDEINNITLVKLSTHISVISLSVIFVYINSYLFYYYTCLDHPVFI